MKKIFLGNTEQQIANPQIKGEYVKIEEEDFYKISNYNSMPPFFMSIVSNSDHWMFISSNGGLTAGRKSPQNSLFPYYTDDKIHDGSEITGSKTIILAEAKDKTYLWEPFSSKYEGVYNIQRNIYKNILGNKLIFEEINNDIGLTFRYSWSNSDRYGFIKNSKILNNADIINSFEIIDGIQNILPFGVDFTMQQTFSTLLDAFKKDELLSNVGLGIYSLSSIPTDKAEPSEGLKTTTVWSVGINAKLHLISSNQLDNFRNGKQLQNEVDVRAARGAYFINAKSDIKKGEEKAWYIVAEINQHINDIVKISNLLKSNKNIVGLLEYDIKKGSSELYNIVANADGIQFSNDKLRTSSHFANVMFNVMRGGIFDHNYNIKKADFIDYVKTTNLKIYNSQSDLLSKLPETIHYSDLLQKVKDSENSNLRRICYEYLPLTFSRRHGDPSRPWNMFSIETKNEDGSKSLDYQGNWRDIFQNWEALSFSFPQYIESMISKFVNATTTDGYNPYRVTRSGIDWEIIDPTDPWSNIGYWGDHQIIYLLKLMEVSKNYHPDAIQKFLSADLFTYANVPYRINKYADILKNPHKTIEFSQEIENLTKDRVKEVGADGKLIWNKKSNIIQVNLTEKLLVTLLSKLSNFIPEGGIWMNTQRPEWNDANNALVGNGISMVTLYYIRRFIKFTKEIYSSDSQKEYLVSAEIHSLFASINQTFVNNKELLNDKISDKKRKLILDELATAGSLYRETIYSGFSENRQDIKNEDLLTFLDIALKYIDHSIAANKRDDNLYHAYNIIGNKTENEISINYLPEMLEGQVALLSSGYLSAKEAIKLTKDLKTSKLFRKDQAGYYLYPDKQLTRFDKKNFIPKEKLNSSVLLKQLIQNKNIEIVSEDENGNFHFNAKFRNREFLKEELFNLPQQYKELLTKEQKLIEAIYEDVFNHNSFTGRSGTFFGYEGLGCIYWHMVSKYILAIQENYIWAQEREEDNNILQEFKEAYYDAQKGLGFNKSPKVYGAFPTDPYSHTPGMAGAQQPGMTGQVKEDIISRTRELGLLIKNGKIYFDTNLFNENELIKEVNNFIYLDVNLENKEIMLNSNSMAFTFCQVPIVYEKKESNGENISVKTNNGEIIYFNNSISSAISASIFNKDGVVKEIVVIV